MTWSCHCCQSLRIVLPPYDTPIGAALGTPDRPLQISLPAVFATAAASAPALLAYNVSPSPTFLNQALAFALWGGFVALTASAAGRGLWRLNTALGLMTAAAAVSWLFGSLPASLALASIGTLAAAALLSVGGNSAAARPDAPSLFAAFSWAWLVAGVLCVLVSLAQVFTPGLPDGKWVAVSGSVGRAVGNMRQPNHLSSLLLWSCIAVVALLELRRLALRPAAALMAAFVFAVVLTASRTGLVSVLLLGLWGLLDRRLNRPTRILLLCTPLIYALSWWGMAQWAALADHRFGGAERLAETDISGSRFGIWKNTLALIQAHPWAGVGWGEFNLAWTLTPLPGRPTAFFDHTHNLPLQLAVELGLPLASVVMVLLLWALGKAALNAWRTDSDTGRAQRCAVLMVLMIGLHSLLEYPLWYAYFLLPAAWALGFAVHPAGPAADTSDVDGQPRWTATRLALLAGGGVLVIGALFSVWDYSRVSAIFQAKPGDAPLAQRIARGQRSVFFAHHADYAAVTSGVPSTNPAHVDRAFDRVSHYLLDTRLMIAWAKSLAARGELDAARHLAARLREFNKADAEKFFESCPQAAVPAAPGLPFQCELPVVAPRWQDFLPAR